MTILGYTPKTLLVSLTIIIPLLFSCNDQKEKATTETSTAPTELSLEQKKQMLNQVTPATSTQGSTQGSMQGVTLNPPHGQPGHRCDIQVGEPLNAPAANSNPIQQSTIDVNNAIPTPMPTSSPSSGGGGINPAHGQPGHRCDVKVGDPL